MKLYGGSSISSEERKILSAQGRIEQNGLVVFKISFASENIDENSNLGNIPNTVYTILKNIIHSDNHHDVAVDNVIPVVPEEEYSCDNVLEGLLDRIKKMEYQAKHEIRGFPSAPHSVLESYQRARGFQSYYLAFRNHHCERSDIEEREGDVENVLTSFKSLAELAKQRLEKRRFTTGVLLTLAAILVSTNMLVKSGDFNIGKHLMDSGVTILQFNFALLLILFFIYLAIDIATTRYIPSLAIWIKGVSWEKKKRWLEKVEAVLIWFYSKHPKFGMLALVLVVLVALLGLWIALVALF